MNNPILHERTVGPAGGFLHAQIGTKESVRLSLPDNGTNFRGIDATVEYFRLKAFGPTMGEAKAMLARRNGNGK